MLTRQKIISHPATTFLFILIFPFLIEFYYSEYIERELINRVGWAVMLWSLAFLTRTRWPFIVIAVFLAIASSIDIAYAVVFNGVFTTSSVEAIAQTNSNEALEFLQDYFSLEALAIIVVYLSISLYLLYNFKPRGFSQLKRYRATAIVFFTIFAYLIISGIAVQQKYGKRLPGIVGAYPGYLKGTESLEAEIEQRKELVANTNIQLTNDLNDKQTYVFFIGESATRTHMSLYDYPIKTTPLLDERDDLIALDNILSNYAQTLPSLRITLTSADRENPSKFSESLSIIDAANLAGFETWWISNQQPLRGTYSVIGNMADKTLFISNDFYGNETQRFDNLVLPKLSLALQSPAKKKVIFIHLMGSHLKYDKRYPDEFKHFSSGPYYSYTSEPTSSQKSFINSYDNTILFSDTIINTAIEKLSDQAKESAGLYSLTYISDHGEEVFHSIDFKGHRPNSITPAMVEIPFITWFSEQYLQTNAKKIETLKDNRSQPAMLDEFFHYSLSLMSIDSDIIDERKDLFSSQYQPRERIVYDRNYDQAIKSDVPLKKAD